jgi:RNA polymerase sigma factor (sigma-70 family)
MDTIGRPRLEVHVDREPEAAAPEESAQGAATPQSVAPDRVAIMAGLADHGPALLTLARFLVRDEAEARDLVQQTLEIALRHLDDLRDPARLGAWLSTIEAREAMRTRRRLLRLVRFDAQIREIPTVAGPDEQALALRDALRRLPPRMRAAVVLHHMAGLSIDETAAVMSVSPNTTKSELKKGLRRLREILDE